MHTEVPLADPPGWIIYLSENSHDRLVVFVHGFNGHPVKAWERFVRGAETREWWQASDMLFIGYDSRRDTIPGVADRLRYKLPQFYPHLGEDVLEVGGCRFRPPAADKYQELVLVGHSLGGVIVRRALVEVAKQWIRGREIDPNTPKPGLLDARVRLFSPASAGIRLGGWLGLLGATGAGRIADMHLRRAPAYTELKSPSKVLESTQRRTEELHARHKPELGALEAHVLWAQPDNVVLPENYDTDASSDSVDNTSHISVCKPNERYLVPWYFVETGGIA